MHVYLVYLIIYGQNFGIFKMGLLDGGPLFLSNLYIFVQILSIANGSQIIIIIIICDVA
jgi:hypothetical protein